MNTKSTMFSYLTFLLVFVFSSCKDDDVDPVIPDTGQQDNEILDNAVASYMSKYNVPSVSLAITKDGKLVYVKAYGEADKEAGTEATISSRFRLASISKSITGIAFMKLLDDGKLNLDDKVFGEGAILGTMYGTKAYNDNLKAITLRNLLNHTVGTWGNDGTDPMFTNPNLDAGELITWTLDNRPVSSAPGKTYQYSNFGYCILGRVIEKLTGKTYEAYVKDEILTPAGVKNMEIGGNTLAERKPNEVKYYGSTTGGTDPYAYQIKRMDAHGGWIASPTDMMRLLVHVDGFASKKDMLSSNAIDEMTKVPSLAVNSYYASGWAVNNADNWWHNGSLPGTNTIWVRTASGYNWAVLTNSRVGGNDLSDLDNLIWSALNAGAKFQDIDQF